RHVLVLDPLQAVARDLPAGLLHGADLGGRAGKRGRDAVDGDRDPGLGEDAVKPPETGAGAVFVDRLHVPVTLARPLRGADDLGEEGLGGLIAVEDAVLAALLVVDDELHRDPGAVRPARIGRRRAIAMHVAGISVHGPPPQHRASLIGRERFCFTRFFEAPSRVSAFPPLSRHGIVGTSSQGVTRCLAISPPMSSTSAAAGPRRISRSSSSASMATAAGASAACGPIRTGAPTP